MCSLPTTQRFFSVRRDARREQIVTECGLCGAPMTGTECRVCGWRVSTTAGEHPVTAVPEVSSPAVRQTSLPSSTGTHAPRPSHNGNEAPLDRGKSRQTWVLVGLLAAALVVGVVAIGLSLSGPQPGTSVARQSAGATSEPYTRSSPSTPPERGNSVPDTPKVSGWITVLESVPQNTGELSHARDLANHLHQQYGVEVFVIDSGDYRGLNPGWWAVVLIGFDTNAEARTACSLVGRSPSGSCYGRQVKG